MAEGIEAGIIGINDPVPATPQCPFGGMKESGLGRELGHEGLEAYLETKYISFNCGTEFSGAIMNPAIIRDARLRPPVSSFFSESQRRTSVFQFLSPSMYW